MVEDLLFDLNIILHSKNPRRAMEGSSGDARVTLPQNSDQGHLEALISVQRNPTKSAGSGARPEAQPPPAKVQHQL